jgi:hypothetical protein
VAHEEQRQRGRQAQGLALLEHEREVLSSELLAKAMARMTPAVRSALLRSMQALIDADSGITPSKKRQT